MLSQESQRRSQRKKNQSTQYNPNCLDAPLFHKNWSVCHELLLLQSLQIFGYEDWSTAAAFVGNGCSPTEVRKHYYKYYASRSLPSDNQWIISQNINPYHYARNKENYEKKEDESQFYKEGMKTLLVNLPSSFGLYEKTKQFNYSYNPTLQLIPKNLRIFQNDTKRQKKQKIKLINIYIEKTKERRQVEKESIRKGLFETKYEMEEKKEDQRKYKRKKIIEKYEIENEPEDIKSLWITYSKLKQYDVNEDLKDDIQKLVQKNMQIRKEKERIQSELQKTK